jgi:hypothetical protein
LCLLNGNRGETAAMQPRAMQNAPGAEQQPFRLLIIGGGPAGISILVRAIRIGVSKVATLSSRHAKNGGYARELRVGFALDCSACVLF